MGELYEMLKDIKFTVLEVIILKIFGNSSATEQLALTVQQYKKNC